MMLLERILKTVDTHYENSKKYMVVKNKIVLVLFLLIGLIGSYYLFGDQRTTSKVEARVLMEVAEQLVREKKPTPIQSSRFYAVVARDYYTTRYISNKEYTYSTSTLESQLLKIVSEDDQKIKPGSRLTGLPYWVSSKPPFSPNAGVAERFVLDKDFGYKVPPPPLYGGDEFKKALALVKDASDSRNGEESAAINFWGGVPGTEAPAGIWQNRFYDVTKKYHLSDKDYAYVQMILAESVADAFMECWKVKYTYWTKRPDMTDINIQTAMPNPPFPGYVSGHSTISFTAATVLARFFPDEKDIFIGDAREAKNSRLWAGIHFSYDNDEGEKLGVAVGEFVIEKLNLKTLK